MDNWLQRVRDGVASEAQRELKRHREEMRATIIEWLDAADADIDMRTVINYTAWGPSSRAMEISIRRDLEEAP